MLKNPMYRKKALPVIILGTLFMYFYSGLQNDHLNVLQKYYAKTYQWSSNAVTMPVTIAGFVVIIATFFIGTLFIKYGVTKILVPSIVVLGLSVIGLANAGDNAMIFNISLFLVRLLVTPLQMGTMMLCTNWFVEYRGRSLGIVTIGSPLCTATLIAGLSAAIASIGFTTSYTFLGIIVIVLAVLTGIFVKSTPEECGLYPDGADKPIKGQEETSDMTIREVFENKGSYLLIISFGLLQFCIVAIMAFYVPRLMETSISEPTYLFWLSAAAILGMPISYILGVIDDKYGTVTASLILCATFIMALAALFFVKSTNSVACIVVAAVGIAGVTGGTPNLHPSITAYVYGRKNYQAANRWIMAIQAVIMTFALTFMSTILDKNGTLDMAYIIMIGMVIIASICLIFIGKKPDYDRANISK